MGWGGKANQVYLPQLNSVSYPTMGLLERDASCGRLKAPFATPPAARAVALVGGEAGVGKSSLVGWFVREHSREAAVLWGQAMRCLPAAARPAPRHGLHSGRLAAAVGGNRAALFAAFWNC